VNRGAIAHTTPWSDAEKETLARVYPLEGAEAAARAIGRPVGPVMSRARRLGLSRKRRWTPDDDQTLRAYWGEMSLNRLAKELQRTTLTVHWRARKLGLETGSPQGTEYLTTAADRTGYDTTTLRRILKAAGVRPSVSMSRPTGSSRHYHIVDPLDVDDAVKAWLECEDVAPAAVARGLIPETLTFWLEAARKNGFDMPERPGGKRRWRIKSEMIDAVVAWRAEHETVAQGAARHGVDQSCLRKWLIEAGVKRWSKKPWFVKRSEVDAVVAGRGA
jgi:hypothetical protein